MCTHLNANLNIVYSNENTQYTIILKNIDKNILIIPPDSALWLTPISSNYPCLELCSLPKRCSSHWSSTVYSLTYENISRNQCSRYGELTIPATQL